MEFETVRGYILVNGRRYGPTEVESVKYCDQKMSLGEFLHRVDYTGLWDPAGDGLPLERTLTLYIDHPPDEFTRIIAPPGSWAVEKRIRRT